MRSSSSGALGAALGLAFILASPRALAEQPDSRALFEEGVKHRKEGRCAEAITAFRRALEAWPQGIGALRNIALCQETLGQYASSRRSWWEVRRLAIASSEPKYDGWEDEAQAAYDRLEAMIALLTVRLDGAGPEQVTLRINGKRLVPKLVGVDLERDVGAYRVEAWRDGKLLARREVELGASQHEEVTLEVELPQGIVSTAVEEVDPLLVGGVAVTAVGALGLAGAIASAIVRENAIGELEDECPGFDRDAVSSCDARFSATIDRGETASILFNVFGAVAIAGIGAGVPMVIVASLGDEPAATGRNPTGAVSLLAGPGGALVRWDY